MNKKNVEYLPILSLILIISFPSHLFKWDRDNNLLTNVLHYTKIGIMAIFNLPTIHHYPYIRPFLYKSHRNRSLITTLP